MPRLIVKPNPDRDLYMEWVTSADGPGRVGSRNFWLAEIREEQEREHRGFTPLPENTPEGIMDRCDEHGSNSKRGNGYWDDTGLVVEGRAWLPRKNFEALMDAYIENGGWCLPDLDSLKAAGITVDTDD